MLAVTVVIAASLAVLIAERTYVVGVCVLSIAIAWPAILTSLAAGHRGFGRAFCIGAAVPAFVGLTLLLLGIHGLSQKTQFATAGDNVDHFILQVAAAAENSRLRILWLLMPVVGLICTAAYWLFVPQGQPPGEGS